MNVFCSVVTEHRSRPVELLLRSVEVLLSYLCPKTGYRHCFFSSVPLGKLLDSTSHYTTAAFKFTIRCIIHVVWAPDSVIKWTIIKVKLVVVYYNINITSCLLFSFYSWTTTKLHALKMRRRSERILSPPQLFSAFRWNLVLQWMLRSVGGNVQPDCMFRYRVTRIMQCHGVKAIIIVITVCPGCSSWRQKVLSARHMHTTRLELGQGIQYF